MKKEDVVDWMLPIRYLTWVRVILKSIQSVPVPKFAHNFIRWATI